jgi:hypothetical protein
MIRRARQVVARPSPRVGWREDSNRRLDLQNESNILDGDLRLRLTSLAKGRPPGQICLHRIAGCAELKT